MNKKVEQPIGTDAEQKPRCGIVMPISPIDGCDEAHWANVREILGDAIRDAGYEPNLVSAADEIGVIQKRIVQNLYENPIVVCDVSGKNPNVMLELGMRLAFDKPVIIVKDDKTTYSFDTSPIEHLGYPRDLRYQTIVDFKESLSSKITNTVTASQKGGHTTFLGHFGQFKVAKIDTQEVTPDKFILSQLQDIRDEIRNLAVTRSASTPNLPTRLRALARDFAFARVSELPDINNVTADDFDKLVAEVSNFVRRRSSGELPLGTSRDVAANALTEVIHKARLKETS
ncbi:RNA helicase [Rhizobium leguminosarum]|uniref:RNA helicase n=1 Tax=Rhizobium leguminosarum TaxID=384 RepID=A0A444I3A4_RHILE|nr:RNA helicase [Rhizobium leguminosarum]RWX32025.1 RNA helicase [Rhizobium leguminosarum]